MAVQYPYRDLSLPEVLQETLADLERYGWKPNTWNVAGPMNIRCALWHVINTIPATKRHDMHIAAVKALATVIGAPLGSIHTWEAGCRCGTDCQPKRHQARTFADVEELLARAVEVTRQEEAA